MAAKKKTEVEVGAIEEMAVPVEVEEAAVPEAPVSELKLPCSATDCDAIDVRLRTAPKVTLYVGKMSNGNFRYGTNIWGLKPIEKKVVAGLIAFRLLTHIKEALEPIGKLESTERVEL